jgi:hypothetical protein
MKLFTIGCSFTEGQGLKRQTIECYSNCLAKTLKLEHYNFGGAGLSNDYIFRKIFELLNSKTIDKNDIILIQWTHFLRKEIPYVNNNKKWYHTIPNAFHALADKVIMQSSDGELSVQNEYIYEETSAEQKRIESKNKKNLEDYSLKFLDEDYQLNTTINYINALYTYLEHFGYKHLHFFGWDKCIIESVFDNKTNFIKESFGEYTNTTNNHHPNKKGHEIWAEFLNEKLIEFKFINPFENQINNYQKNLYKLKIEIEEEIPNLFKERMEKIKTELKKEMDNTNKIIKIEKQKEIEEEINKIRIQKELQMENHLIAKQKELDKIEKQLKERLDKSKKTKTLI